MADQEPKANIGSDIWRAIPDETKTAIITGLLSQLLGLLSGLFKKKKPATPADVPAPKVEPDDDVKMPGTTPLPTPTARQLGSLGLGLQWAADTQGNLRDDGWQIAQGEAAINWDCDFRLDTNPRDQKGVGMGRPDAPGTAEGARPVVEWFYTWEAPGGSVEGPSRIYWPTDGGVNPAPEDYDGPIGDVAVENPVGNIAIGSRPYRNARGYCLKFRAAGRRSGRHYITIWNKVGAVESNRIKLAID